MKTKLSETGERNFDLLTTTTFYVIDTEYTATRDGSKTNSIISLAIVPVRQGRIDASDLLYCEMNPGVPISAESSKIHGFTDEMMKKKRRFDYYVPKIMGKLSETNAVLVCHTSADVHALRAELSRLDERYEKGEDLGFGLADLPDLKVIDTSRLAKTVGYPGVGSRSMIGLSELCKLTGVTNQSTHNAKSDALATAEALIELLAFAAQAQSIADLGQLLRKHNAKTTHDPAPAPFFRDRKTTEPQLSKEHVTKHALQLDHAASEEEIAAWVELANECANLRCSLLVDDAIVAGELNAAALLAPLRALLPALAAPGQAATLLGALCELLDPRDREGGAPIAGTNAIRKWREDWKQVITYPKCGLDFPEMCPSCRSGEICPLDRLHQLFAENALFGEGKEFDQAGFRELFRLRHSSRIRNWAPLYPELAAYAAWLAIARAQEWKSQQPIRIAVDAVIELGLHKIEPRLTLIVADEWVTMGRFQDALDLCDQALLHSNTDPAFAELEAWTNQVRADAAQRSRAPIQRVITHTRLARPAGRVNPNPYRV